MARYNTKVVTPTVVNHQGGDSYKLDPKFELISLLSTEFKSNYYELIGEKENRLKELIKFLGKKDPEFVAKALIYARTILGYRTITHFGSVMLAPYISGTNLAGKFFTKRDRKENKGGIIYRLDDMLEITAFYNCINTGKPLSNSMKKGFKNVLENADRYELAKYRGVGKSVSLVDIVNLVHPKPSKDMEDTFKSLMNGTLKQFNTVEDKNTKSGTEIAKEVKEGKITKGEAENKLKLAKEENYEELINTKKIGYLALLRNLRNILKNSSNSALIDKACELLIDEKFIRKSLVFPHQIDLALEVLMTEFSNSQLSKISKALNTAYELAIPNLTELFPSGKTAVIVDSSGSMSSKIQLGNRRKSSESAISKASLVAATLAKGIGADVYHFANTTEEIKFNINDSVNTLKNKFINKQGQVGYATVFNSIFKTIGNKYDRIFIISDMQGKSYLDKKSYKDMYVYSVDIIGYGTTMFKPGDKVFALFGYTSEMYELIKKVEIDPKVILKEIEAINI